MTKLLDVKLYDSIFSENFLTVYQYGLYDS